MKRLIKSGLMFGNLIHVASPALVERYNRALKHLTGRTTELTDFYIDISGYSPEVGHELNDHLYLNHKGVNRQFILLTTDQKDAPLLNAQFSTSRSILRQFIEENESALFSLTTRDAVAGELVNSVYDLSSPARLFDIRKIVIEADTTNGAIAQAGVLDDKVTRFMNEEDAWFDDVLIAEMIELANETGDVLRNPVNLKHMEFDQRNYWTEHFGGVYIFQKQELPGAITALPRDKIDHLPIDYVIDLRERNRLANFLELNGLVEPIVKARGINASAVLKQKMDFILVDALADEGINLRRRSKSDMRRLARQHADKLPSEFHALAELVNWAENKGRWPRITSEDPAYFYTLRAANHSDADLVNMLLAQMSPKDFRQLFICHKQLFYQMYGAWSDTKKEYVVEYLKNEYQVDKVGAREALFGHEPAMEEKPIAPKLDGGMTARVGKPDDWNDLINRVGPWGPIKGR